MEKPKTKILLDSGDPKESEKIKNLLGFLDGQTTNPSLVAHNPEIQELLARGEKMTKDQAEEKYKEIIEKISKVVGDAGVSIEVFAAPGTSAQEMFEQGKKMYSWTSNAFIKYPCTAEGLRAVEMSIKEGMRVNITLVFSQQQAAAVYAASRGAQKGSVYLSPFIGRLDDKGQNGVDLIRNILEMYKSGDGHVEVLSASIRGLDHLYECFRLGSDLVTVPAKILEQWTGAPIPEDFKYKNNLQPIPYEEISLDQGWESYNLQHDLTDAGIKKFDEDYYSTVMQ